MKPVETTHILLKGVNLDFEDNYTMNLNRTTIEFY